MRPLPHNQKRLSGWTILWTVVIFCLLISLAPLPIFWVWNANQALLVKKLETDIRASGEPALGEELVSHFPLQKGQENVAELWLAGINALQTSENNAAAIALPFVGEADPKPLPKLSDPWPELAQCEAFLHANQFALDQFHQAAQRGGLAKFETDYSQGYLTPFTHLKGILRAAQILQMEVEVKARKGDPRGAAEALRALLTLPRFFDHEPSMIAFLMKKAVDNVATRTLAEKLCVVPWTKEELLEFQQLVRSNEPDKFLRMAMVGERAVGNNVLRDPHQLGEERPAFSPLNGDKVSYLMLMNDLIAALDRDYPNCFDAYARVEQDYVRKSRSWAGQWTMAYTVYLMPQIFQYQIFAAQDMVHLRALDAAIAIELYRRDKGALPDSLEELVPQYLASIPVDPFNGAPLQFEKHKDTMQFRSAGLKTAGKSKNQGAEIIVIPLTPQATPHPP